MAVGAAPGVERGPAIASGWIEPETDRVAVRSDRRGIRSLGRRGVAGCHTPLCQHPGRARQCCDVAEPKPTPDNTITLSTAAR